MAGTLTIDTLQDGSSNSSSVTDVVKGSARAWVNFNGTGTVAIRAAYNVSSITDYGVGVYGANFTNSLSDSNYSSITSVIRETSNGFDFSSVESPTVSSVVVRTGYGGQTTSYTNADRANTYLAVLGN